LQCFPRTNSTARGLQLRSIIRKLHLCACARLNSRSFGKIIAEIAVISWKPFYCQGTITLFHNQETAPLRMLKLRSRLLARKVLKSQIFPGIIFTAMGPKHCSIIRKLHHCTCARLSSRSLGKISAEIAVYFLLSYNNFYCQGTTALFHNQETAPPAHAPD
jgi:hypothetical protein